MRRHTLNIVKIKDTFLPELSLNTEVGFAFTSYLRLQGTVGSSGLSTYQNVGKLWSVDKIRIKEIKVRKLEAAEMKK